MIISHSLLLCSKMVESIETALGSIMSMCAVSMETAILRKATALISTISPRNVVIELVVNLSLLTLPFASRLIYTLMSVAMLQDAIIVQLRPTAHGMATIIGAVMIMDSAMLNITALKLIFSTSNAAILLNAMLLTALYALTLPIAKLNAAMVLTATIIQKITALINAIGQV